MSPLRHVPERLQHWLVPYVLILLTLIAIGIAVTYRVQSTKTDAGLHSASVSACRRSNVVRTATNEAIQALSTVQVQSLNAQIAQSHAIPPRFFPTIPLARFHELVQQQNAVRRANIRDVQRAAQAADANLKPTDCSAAFPAP